MPQKGYRCPLHLNFVLSGKRKPKGARWSKATPAYISKVKECKEKLVTVVLPSELALCHDFKVEPFVEYRCSMY